MIPSSLHNSNVLPLHAAIIMDGSGRWAQERGLERRAGHRAGVEAVRRVVLAAPRFGISTLTLHAFSSDNWWRPPEEVHALLRIFEDYIEDERENWAERGVRLSVMGRRDRLPAELLMAIETAEAATRAGRNLVLRLGIDYSAREAILCAARHTYGGGVASPEEFSRRLAEAHETRVANSPRSGESPTEGIVTDVDLLIRTGGEQRVSDFLLWEIAYAELIFTKRLWPDFDASDLEAAIVEFHSRDRRFGRLPATVAG